MSKKTMYDLWCIEMNIKSPDYFLKDILKLAKTDDKFKDIAEYLNGLESTKAELRQGAENKQKFLSNLNLVYNVGIELHLELVYVYLIGKKIENMSKTELLDHVLITDYMYKEYLRDFDNFMRCLENAQNADDNTKKQIIEMRKPDFNSFNIDLDNLKMPEIPEELMMGENKNDVW